MGCGPSGGGPSGGGGVTYERTAFVDAVSGDNGTAELNNPSLPYISIGAAANDLLAAYTSQPTTIRLDYTENAAGILLNDDVESPGTVWMSWIPESMKFGNTAWVSTSHDYAVGDRVVHNDSTATTHNACYKCLVAHNSTDYATFALADGKWLLLPVLAILEEFVYAHMQGAYLIRNGSPETGFAMQSNAISAVEKLARDEANNRNRS